MNSVSAKSNCEHNLLESVNKAVPSTNLSIEYISKYYWDFVRQPFQKECLVLVHISADKNFLTFKPEK